MLRKKNYQAKCRKENKIMKPTTAAAASIATTTTTPYN